MAKITLTRQQLYDRAWTTPLDTLARELGVSARGLGRLCERHDIPVPPPGWWAKKSAGHRVRQTPLRPAPRGTATSVTFEAPDDAALAGKESPASETHPLVLYEREEENRIQVADDLPLTDPLVLKTQRLLNKGKRGSERLIPPPAGALHIHTSRPLHDRALRIMQALLLAFQKRGYPVSATADGVRVTILDEKLGFGVEERLKKIDHAVKFTEQKLIDRGLGYQVPKFDHVPSGDLTLLITNVHGIRQRWAEGAYKPAEGLLNRFIVGLVRAALGLKRQRAEAERRERERLEQERLHQEEARRLAEAELRWREEKARVERLERLAAMRQRSRELRLLVEELRGALGDIDAASTRGQWLQWATDYAVRSDPLETLRKRDATKLVLYYYGYDHQRVKEEGFTEPELTQWTAEKDKPGIPLTERPPRLTSYERALKLELRQDLVLPFEWAQESDWFWREFRIPAALLNAELGIGHGATTDNAPNESA